MEGEILIVPVWIGARLKRVSFSMKMEYARIDVSVISLNQMSKMSKVFHHGESNHFNLLFDYKIFKFLVVKNLGVNPETDS